MRAGIIALLGVLGGCSGLTHFEDYQSAGDGATRDGGSMDAPAPPRDADLGDCPPIGESCNNRDDDCDGEIDEAGAESSCTAGVHATGSCSAGACVYTCETGFADCDSEETDCESDLGNPMTCRSCTTQCGDEAPLCSATGCTAVCPAGQTECGGACVSTMTDTEHCGGCSMPCMIPNGTPRCAAGDCEVLACDPLWADCNDDPSDGCEQRLDTPAHCGACGIACDPDHATASCLGGTCTIVTCESGWDDCDGRASNGCEGDLSAVISCGRCTYACPAAGAHADVTCDESTYECVYACDSSRYADCDGTEESCEVDLSVNGNCGACGVSCTPPSTCITLPGGAYGCSGAEICGNGADDDMDGLTDCADTVDCMATHVCVPPVPGGWTGPVQLYDGPRTGAPSCSGAFASNVYDGFDGLMPGAHSCTMCSCSAPTGVSCSAPSLTIWTRDTTITPPPGDGGRRDGSTTTGDGGTGACSGCALTVGASRTCGTFDGGTCAGSDTTLAFGVEVGTSTPSGGSCTPSGGIVSTGSPSWSDLGRACMPSTGGMVGGCAMGTTCWPRPAGAPWLPRYCVQHDGAVACPGTPYTMQHVFYGDFSDTRGCSSCVCGTPGGAICSGDVAFYGPGDPRCTADYLGTFRTADSCASLNRMAIDHTFVGTSSFTGGVCTRSGGISTGSVMPTTPTTFCCIP